jgi:hypothetical protein
MPDEVPLYVRRCLRHLRDRFLHLILTDLSNSVRRCGFNGVGTVRLRDRDNLDSLPMPSSRSRALDSLSNLSDAVAEVGKRHKVLS